jgi:hypothetical protein
MGMMPAPKIILFTYFNKAILVANNAGMNQDEIDSHRDEIIESAADTAVDNHLKFDGDNSILSSCL